MSCELCKDSTSIYCRICNPMTIYQMGTLGGIARAKKLSPERRKEIATRASHSRKKKV